MEKFLSIHEVQDILQEDQRQLEKTVTELRSKETTRLSSRQPKRKDRRARRTDSQK